MAVSRRVGRSIAALCGALTMALMGTQSPARGQRAPAGGAERALGVPAGTGSIAGQDPDRRYLLGVRGLDLLAVEFMAVAEDGSPIRDLRTDEVTLRIDGRPRPIRTLQLIAVADPWFADDEIGAAPLPPPFGTNTTTEAGRTVIVVIEDASLRTGHEDPVREAVDRFLTSLSARDRAVLVTMPYGGIKVNLTTEHDRIRSELARLVGQATPDETGSDLACRTRRTLEALVGLLDGLTAGEGPAIVLFISSGLAAPRRDAPPMLGPGVCELTTDLFEQVGGAAGAARAHFYVIQPEDPELGPGAIQTENIAGVGFEGSDNPLAGLEHLAGVTRAHRIHLSAGAGALERVTRETSAYYRIAFEPSGSDRNGERHQLSVRVAREAVGVRLPPEITFPRAEAGGRPAPDTPQQMLAVAPVFRDLPLRATAYASGPPADGKLKVVSVVEPVDPAVTLASVAVGLVDVNGRLVVQWTATAADLTRTPVLAAMTAPAGTYRLRAAAIDASGRRGTADDQVAVELGAAGDLTLSSLVLGLARSEGFTPRLQFTDEPVAIAHLELYGGSPGAPVSTVLELAASPGGPALMSVPLTITATSNAGRYVATGALPIGGLPDGDFVVRARVGVEGQPAGQVARTLRKVVG